MLAAQRQITLTVNPNYVPAAANSGNYVPTPATSGGSSSQQPANNEEADQYLCYDVMDGVGKYAPIYRICKDRRTGKAVSRERLDRPSKHNYDRR